MGPRPAAQRPCSQAARRAPGGLAEPTMPVSVARPGGGPWPPLASPFLLLMLAVLSGPVSGSVPRSVPRTSLPISGKGRAPSLSAFGPAPRSRPQVPASTCTPDPPGSCTRGPLSSVLGLLHRTAHSPPAPGRDPPAPASRVSYHHTPRRLRRSSFAERPES